MGLGLNCKGGTVNSTVGRRISGFYFINPSCTARTGSALTRVVVGLLPSDFKGMFFAGTNTSTGRGTMGVTEVFANEGGMFDHCEDCRNSSFNTNGLANRPEECPLRPNVPKFMGFFSPCICHRTVGFRSRRRTAGFCLAGLHRRVVCRNPSDMTTVMVRAVANSGNMVVPPGNCLPNMEGVYSRFKVLVVYSRIVTN